MLSRVDGKTNAAAIAASTGLSREQVTQALDRLESLRAIHYGEPARRSGPVARSDNGETSDRVSLISEPPAWRAQIDPREALYDPAELDQPGDLERDRKRLILDVFYRLDALSHYELLGVLETADKKLIKSAYYAAVNVFHPDRYFGKDVGPFKTKLERVFRRLTEAHDALSSEQTRQDYDRYLQARRRTLGYEGATAEALRKAEVERARAQIEEAARAAQAASPATHQSSPRIERVSDPGERRRALARKLSGSRGVRSSIPPEAQRTEPPPMDMEQQRKYVAEDLRRRYKQYLLKARESQVARYVADAKQALLAKDAVSAANLLKIALSLNPSDVGVEAELAEVERMASSELFSSYLEQARYEEREHRPLEAARSYQRAAKIKPSAALFERAAHCLLEAESEPNMAVELGKKAVLDAPPDKLASYRLTLARAYLERGMKQSAIAELERAQELEPNNDTIKDWLRRAKRHESGA